MHKLKLFGKPQIYVKDDWLEPALTKPFCLAAYLAYHETWVSRDQLAFLFWPDSAESSARRNLRQLLNRAKQLNGVDLVIEGARLHWPIVTDVQAFRQAIASQHWADALTLYSGSLLSNLVSDAEGFNTWLELERESLARAWQEASFQHAKILETSGNYDGAAACLKNVLNYDDLSEDILQQYLRLAYLAGQREDALKQFEQFRQRLKDELDLEPLAETLELIHTLKQSTSLPIQVTQTSKPKVPLSVLRPPELVGRNQELRLIQESQETLVVLAGEAGVGKSRLMAELAPKAVGLRCHEGLEQVPYYPLIQWIRQSYQSLDLNQLGPYLDDLLRLVPDLKPDHSATPADAETARARLLEALYRYLALSFPDTGFQLMIDDLQWADEASLAFLVFLVNQKPLRLLAAYRRYELNPRLKAALDSLSSSRKLKTINLHSLSPEAMRQLLAQLMQHSLGPELFANWLWRSTGGNPMFALETLRSLFETSVLHSDERGWHSSIDELTHDYSEFEVPVAVSDMIQRRIRSLSEPCKRLLEGASVARQDLSPEFLSQLTGLSEWAALEAFEEAESKGILKASSFSHDLLRQSIYQNLSPNRKRLVHERVANLLSEHYDPAIIANHYLAAEKLELAIPYWIKAAQTLRERGLHEDANSLLTYALNLSKASEQKWALYTGLAAGLKELGHCHEALALADKVLENTHDTILKASSFDIKAGALVHLGQLDEAEQMVRQGLQLEDLEAPNKGNLNHTLGIVYTYKGQFEEALALHEPMLALLRKNKPDLELCILLTNVAALYDQLGRHKEALPLHLEGLAVSKRIGYKKQQVDSALNLLYCYMDLAETAKGIAPALEALELGRFEGSEILEYNLATAYLELGKTNKAQDHFEHICQSSSDPTLLTTSWAKLADLASSPEARAKAIAQMLGFVQKTEFDIARARAVINALKYGDNNQQEKARDLFKQIKLEGLAPYLRQELEQALNL